MRSLTRDQSVADARSTGMERLLRQRHDQRADDSSSDRNFFKS